MQALKQSKQARDVEDGALLARMRRVRARAHPLAPAVSRSRALPEPCAGETRGTNPQEGVAAVRWKGRSTRGHQPSPR